MVKFNELGIDLSNNKLIIDASIKDNTYYENVYIDTIYIDTQDTYIDGGPSKTAKSFNVYKGTTEDGLNPFIYKPASTGDSRTYRIPFPIADINRYVLDLSNVVADFIIIDSLGDSYETNFDKPGVKYNIFEFIDGDVIWKEGGTQLSELNSIRTKHARLELNTLLLDSTPNDNMYFVYVKVKGTPDISTPCGADKEYTLGVTLNTCTIYNNMMYYIGKVVDRCDIPKELIDYYLKFEALVVSINTGHNMQAVLYYNKYFKNKNINSMLTNRCSCNG